VTELCSGMMRADGTTEQLDRAAVSKAVDTLAARGLRVLATAVSVEATPAGLRAEALDGHFVLSGLQEMLDPPRQAVTLALGSVLR